jgi:hypothetical protein
MSHLKYDIWHSKKTMQILITFRILKLCSVQIIYVLGQINNYDLLLDSFRSRNSYYISTCLFPVSGTLLNSAPKWVGATYKYYVPFEMGYMYTQLLYMLYGYFRIFQSIRWHIGCQIPTMQDEEDASLCCSKMILVVLQAYHIL